MNEEKIKFNNKLSALFFLAVFVFSSATLMLIFVSKADAGSKTYNDSVSWNAIGSKGASINNYYNWTGWNACPGLQGGCYLSRIELKDRTFTNTGGGTSAAGASYIRLADSANSNCTTPSSATFPTRYTAYSPALGPGVSDTANDCGAGFGKIGRAHV